MPVRQPWVVDLGVFPTDVAARETWLKIKQAQSQFAQMVHYLEPDGAGRRLLAGPFWGEEAARVACAGARSEGVSCSPVQASAVRSGSVNTPAPTAASSGQ